MVHGIVHHIACSHISNLPLHGVLTQACGYLTSVERLDPRTGRWAAVASLGEVRACLGAVEILGVLYAVGGRNMLKAQPRAWAASWCGHCWLWVVAPRTLEARPCRIGPNERHGQQREACEGASANVAESAAFNTRRQ